MIIIKSIVPSRVKNVSIIIALLASLLSLVSTPANATNECIPEVTESGGYVILKFTNPGTCTFTTPAGATVMQGLVVGGGGGGGSDLGGGGGGGGYLDFETLTVTSQTLSITVGAGGAGAPDGYGPGASSGQPSLISGTGISLTALGGAAGASLTFASIPAASGGGSGGGSSGDAQFGLAGNSSNGVQDSQMQTPLLETIGGVQHGNNGSLKCLPNSGWFAGGGGGAGSAGTCNPGKGGDGFPNSILGTTYFWAGGGGATGHDGVAGDGGSGGGGGGGMYAGSSTASGGSGLNTGGSSPEGLRGGSGGENTGGGGGGGSFRDGSFGFAGGDGGSGIVVLKYLAPAPGSAAKLRLARSSSGFERRSAFSTQPQIGFADSAFNTVMSGSAVITATISSGGTLLGTTTATASGGVATFADLAVDGIVGKTYTITYSAPGYSPTTEKVVPTTTTCDGTSFKCQVGDVDPNGGLIFYASDTPFKCGPNHADDCNYLEAAPKNWAGGSADPGYKWSNVALPVDGISRDGSPNMGSDQLGLGLKNSNVIAAYDTDSTNAAVATRSYNGGGYSNWYLPTISELGLLCQVAHGQVPNTNNPCHYGRVLNTQVPAAYQFLSSSYQSSSQSGIAGSAQWHQNFVKDPYTPCSSQQSTCGYAGDPISTRPIRAFAAVVNVSNGNYPCGGGGTFPIVNKVVGRATDTCTGAVEIPYGVTSIAQSAFWLRAITSVSIPNTVKTIGDYAFFNTSITSLVIPGSIESIGQYGFAVYPGNLTNIIFANESNLTSIGSQAFVSNLTSITLPSSVTSISPTAFQQTPNLSSITFNGLIPTDSPWSAPSSALLSGRVACGTTGYFVIHNNIAVARHNCTGSVDIPNGVTRIEDQAFDASPDYQGVGRGDHGNYDNSWIPTHITSITIPNTVTSIGDYAFRNLVSPTLVIPNSVDTLGAYCFMGSSAITSLTLSSNLTSIPIYAFYGLSGLTTLTVPDTVTAIGSTAFAGMTSVETLTISQNVTTLPEWAFASMTNIKSLTIPAALSSIGYGSFSGMASITSLTIPNTVTSIDPVAFQGMHSLTSLTLPNNISTISNQAFAEMYSLPSLTIPSAVTTIGASGFAEMHAITSLSIPSTVTSIGASSFQGMTNVTSLTIPNSLTRIPNSAFSGMTNLPSLSIPSSVTTIGDGAFFNMASITDLTIPNSVTSIGVNAFQYMTDLLTLVIPNSVTTIGAGAFWGASSVTSLTISNNVTTLNDWTFAGMTDLPSLTIPSSVTTIGNRVFSDMSSISTLVIPNSVTTIGGAAFYSASNLRSLTIGSSVTEIGGAAFYGATNLGAVTIPGNVTLIGGSAFENCSSLNSITLRNGVVTIGDNAFYGAGYVTSIVIPNSTTTIGNAAFANLPRLSQITIGRGVTSIGTEAFSNNPALIRADIPNNVTSMGAWAFGYDSMLSVVTIGSGLTTIAPYAFASTPNLTRVSIPNSITSIGASAFFAPPSGHPWYHGPSIMNSLTIPSSVVTIGANAFAGLSALATLNFCGSLSVLNDAGFGAVSPACSITAPDSPTDVSATVVGPGAVDVSFNSPVNNGGAAIGSFTATASAGGFTRSLYQSNGGTFSFTGLANSTTYTFTVTASNWGLTSSASLASNSVTTPSIPNAPTSVTVAMSDSTTALITYTAPANDGGDAITAYTATTTDNGGLTATVSRAGSGTISIPGLTRGQSYSFTVVATNGVGNSVASGSASITAPDYPSAPTNVSASFSDSTTATISFTPGSDGGSAITSYTATATGGLTPISRTISAPATSITVPGLARGTSYTFTVLATNSVGDSSASSPTSSMTTWDIPSAPTSVSATAGDGTATISFTPGSDGGSSITNYEYSFDGNFFTPLSPAVTSSPLTISGLTNGTSYTIYLAAVNAIGASMPSSSVSITPAATISTTAITGLAAPVFGETPVATITSTAQFTGAVTWSGSPSTFLGATTYTATITLTAEPGYTLNGVSANSFTVAGATSVTNDANTGVITAIFPRTSLPDYVPADGAGAVACGTSGYFTISHFVLRDSTDCVGTVVIPAGVESIDADAFSNGTDVSSVYIPNSVTSIGQAAFAGVSNLQTVSFEANSTLTNIGSVAFVFTGLTNITIPKSVTSIGPGAFAATSSLQSVTFETGIAITEIATSTFYGDENLQSIEIPNSVTSIGESAFQNNYSLNSLIIPNSVTTIGASALRNLYSLTSLVIPNSVTFIGENALHNSDFHNLVISNALTDQQIGQNAFSIDWTDSYTYCGSADLLSAGLQNFDTANQCPTMPEISLSSSELSVDVGSALDLYTVTNNGGPADIYWLSPALQNGTLTFDHSTGVISGTPSAAQNATTYTITAANAAGDYLATVTLTVNDSSAPPPPPPAPPAISAQAPDPDQRSKILSITPATIVVGSMTTVMITGLIIEKITSVQIDGVALTRDAWIQNSNNVLITMPLKPVGTYSIQIFNGAVPILPAQKIEIAITAPKTSSSEESATAKTPDNSRTDNSSANSNLSSTSKTTKKSVKPKSGSTSSKKGLAPIKSTSLLKPGQKIVNVQCFKGKELWIAHGVNPKCPTGFAPKNVQSSPSKTSQLKPGQKIINVKCVKGKEIWIAHGVNPKCPKGYVKK